MLSDRNTAMLGKVNVRWKRIDTLPIKQKDRARRCVGATCRQSAGHRIHMNAPSKLVMLPVV